MMAAQEMTRGQTLEQERAGYALRRVREALADARKRDDPAKFLREYGSHVKRLPAMILTNGLGQALAFFLAKAEGDLAEPPGRAYRDVAHWLKERVYTEAGSSQQVIEQLVSGSRQAYQQATEEALAVLNWFVRFVDAFLPSGESESREQASERRSR